MHDDQDAAPQSSPIDEPIEDLTSIWGGITQDGQLANQGAC